MECECPRNLVLFYRTRKLECLVLAWGGAQQAGTVGLSSLKSCEKGVMAGPVQSKVRMLSFRLLACGFESACTLPCQHAGGGTGPRTSCVPS